MAQNHIATAEDLMKMKKELEVKENRVRVLEGKNSALLDRLKKDFGLNSLDAAKRDLVLQTKKLEKDDADFLLAVSALKDNFAWGFVGGER
jgi:hypothetical protein